MRFPVPWSNKIRMPKYSFMSDIRTKSGLIITSLSELEGEWFGPAGSPERDQYEWELKIELLSEAIKQARKSRHLTQQQLGEMVGVGKAQISKLENSPANVTFGTLIKVFAALEAKVKFRVELNGMPEVAIQ